jgi:hypothetical protein
LTDEQKASNNLKSKGRCRIEHIFGAQKMRMGNEILRTIGIIRAKFLIGMRNLVYNRSRLVSLKCAKGLCANKVSNVSVLNFFIFFDRVVPFAVEFVWFYV